MRELVRQMFGAAIGLIGAALIILSLVVVVTAVVLPHPLLSISSSTESEKALLASALGRFCADVGRYPTTEEGLAVLQVDPGLANWSGPYLRQHPSGDCRYQATDDARSYLLGSARESNSKRTGPSLQIVLHWDDEPIQASLQKY